MFRSLLPLLLCCLFYTGLNAQSALLAELAGCPTPPKLYRFATAGFAEVAPLEKTADDTYAVHVDDKRPAFYYIGTETNNLMPVLLGGEKELTLRADCNSLAGGVVLNSPTNAGYDALKKTFGTQNVAYQQAAQLYQRAAQTGDEAEMKRRNAEMMVIDQAKRDLLDSLKRTAPFLGRIAALNTYLSFANNNTAGYANEIDYFVNTFFQFVDYSDPLYNEIPWTFESTKNYTTTLLKVLGQEQMEQVMRAQLAKWPAGSNARKLAHSGTITALKAGSHPALLTVADDFVATYKDSDPAIVASIEQEISQIRDFQPGGQAPDFSQDDVDGKPVKLSDFRGKVTLVDFWASWCGPCRKENPNVRALYNKYQDEGFDILAVSLDKDRDRWLGAIEQDQLPWTHVSDLKGWANEVAQQYSVRSIPHTILLDTEGKIIARNLRGDALEAKLAELFPDAE